jgi:hypothetical protein
LGDLPLNAAQANLANAQAAKLEAETPTKKPPGGVDPVTGEITSVAERGHSIGDLTVQNLAAQYQLKTAEATQVKANTAYISSLASKADADTAVANVTAKLSGQKYDIIVATKQALIDQALAQGAEAKNVGNLMRDPFWGPVISAIDRLVKPAASAAGAVLP